MKPVSLNKSILKIAIFISLFLFFFQGCKGQSEDSSDLQSVQELPWDGSPESIPAALRKENPVASQNAVKGGVFKYYAHQYPKSLNYYLDQFSSTAQIFTMMFEPLTANHPVTLEPIPYLAKSWEISSDKKKFTFHLDPNAKWSDGKPVTSADVMFTYKTIMDKKNNTAVFRIGLSRFLEPTAPDTHTVIFTAKDPHWNNFNEVATGILILPEHALQGKDFNKINFEFPVVSGPFRLAEARKGRFVKMDRRGDWWQRAYPFNRGRYNFDKILFKVFNEEAIALQSFKKGEMDLFGVYTASVWAKDAAGEKLDKNWIRKQRIFNIKPVGFQGWAMNMRRDVFSDRRVRKAICHLVDRKTMVEKLAYNEYEPTNSYYPDFYLRGEKNPNPVPEFSLDAARKLLKEAGWKANTKGILEKDGKEFEFKILDRDKRSEKYFTVFMEKAREVGIKASIEMTDLAGWSERTKKFDYDMTWATWGSGIFKDPEPQWFSGYADEKGQHNITGLKIPEVDKLIELQKTEFDIKKRNELLKKIDLLIYKEYPYVLLWHITNTRILYWDKFGQPPSPLGVYGDESYSIDYWWLDKEKEKTLESAVRENKALPTYPAELRLK